MAINRGGRSHMVMAVSGRRPNGGYGGGLHLIVAHGE